MAGISPWARNQHFNVRVVARTYLTERWEQRTAHHELTWEEMGERPQAATSPSPS